MIPKIQNSQRFREDYNNFQKQIGSVQDQNQKDQLTQLLAQLKAHVGFIDQAHEQMQINGKISTEVSELRQEVLRIKTLLTETLLSAHQA